MHEFVVELDDVQTFDAFVIAFNNGFCRHFGGEWSGHSWDAFNDYLCWPDVNQYRLVFRGWNGCGGLNEADRKVIREIVAYNPHVNVMYAGPSTLSDSSA